MWSGVEVRVWIAVEFWFGIRTWTVSFGLVFAPGFWFGILHLV
jgi:hypothetical protein